MTVGVGQDGIGVVVVSDLGGTVHVVVVEETLHTDVRNIVELGDDVVEELGSDESVLSLELRSKVTERDNGGLIRSDEDGSDEELVMSHPLGLAKK